MGYFLYILKSKSAYKYYTGTSINPESRLGFHITIEKGFTSRYRPWEIVFKQAFESKQLDLISSYSSYSLIRFISREDF